MFALDQMYTELLIVLILVTFDVEDHRQIFVECLRYQRYLEIDRQIQTEKCFFPSDIHNRFFW